MSIPDADWFEEACRIIQHPIAFVDTDHRYLWVNQAYSHLLGYSGSELRGVTWMSVTAPQDVGGDLTSVNDVLSGSITSYTLLKRYVRKNGTMLPVAITVWRYPSDLDDNVLGFTIQATSEVLGDIGEIRQQHEAELAKLRERMDAFEQQQQNFAKIGDSVRKWAPILSIVGGGLAWIVSRLIEVLRPAP